MNIVIALVFAFILGDVADGYVFTSDYGNCNINDGLKLINHNGTLDDGFGYAVAIRNNTVIVGSYKDDVNGNVDVGSVQVYTISGNTAQQLKAKITPNGAKANDSCGSSVALNSKYFVFGCDSPSNRGTVYVSDYHGNARKWVYKQLVPDDSRRGDRFGKSIAINDNDELVIGAPGINPGIAYVFTHNGTDWVQTQTLKNIYGKDYNFGWSVAISTSHIVVSRPALDGNATGTVDIYMKSADKWGQRTTIGSRRPKKKDYFGAAVGTDDKVVVVSAHGENRIYLYSNGVHNTWSRMYYWRVLTSDFGDSLSFNQKTTVTGTYKYVWVRQTLGRRKRIATKFHSTVSFFGGKLVIGNQDAPGAYVFTSFDCPSHGSTTPAPNQTVMVVGMAIVAMICWIKH